MIRTLFVALICIVLSGSGYSQPKMDTRIFWKDQFTTTEKEKLAQWLEGVSIATAETLGQYPLQVNLYIHLSDRDGQPVPWAHTVRHGEQGVHFYVNTDYPLSDFQQDWTAPHELSHLSIPFLGRENMWFAEGYASFMQWHILEAQGILSAETVQEKYRTKLESAVKKYDKEISFIEMSRELLKRHDYPAVYWGGACYFFQVDSALRRQHHTDLFAVIKKYQQDGRLRDQNLEDLVNSLDRISQSEVFSSTLDKFEHKSGLKVLQGTSVNE